MPASDRVTMENLKSRGQGIKMTDIPQTLQDAVLITRKLGYRYPWIDSLCIIQNSASDWQTESVRMAEVYFNAVLNISADASPSSDRGILATSNILRPKLHQFPVRSPEHDIHTYIYAYVNEVEPELDRQSLLQQQAWGCQEAALSRRRLRYTCRGMFWQCCTT
jgi:hypothetical protein